MTAFGSRQPERFRKPKFQPHALKIFLQPFIPQHLINEHPTGTVCIQLDAVLCEQLQLR